MQQAEFTSVTLKITFYYLIFALVWIFFSDTILAILVDDPHILSHIQTSKGILFVLFTALALYVTVSRFMNKIRQQEVELQEQNEDLAAAEEELRQQLDEHEITHIQLRQSEALAKSLINQAADAFFYHDAQGIILEVNQQACNSLGYDHDEMIGMHVCDLDATIPREKFQEVLADILPRTPVTIVSGHRRKDGSVFPVELRIGSLPALEGVRFVVLARDITARVKAETEIKDLNTDLERRVDERTAELAKANQEIEAFSYSVSHDLRAPLRHIDGYSRALAEDYAGQLDEQGKDYIHRICGAVTRMGRLIDDLLQLAFVSRSELQRSSINLSDLAHAVLGEMKHVEPGRNISLLIGDDIIGRGDALLLRIVLENLLGNAWKYTCKNEHAVLEFGETIRGGEKTYFVRDNGVGFDMSFANKLFKPFQRLHNSKEFEGTGIGLASVRKIVERHGGHVWAEGIEGEGATVFFTLGTCNQQKKPGNATP